MEGELYISHAAVVDEVQQVVSAVNHHAKVSAYSALLSHVS